MKGNIIEEYKEFINILKEQNEDLKEEIEDLREENEKLWDELKHEREKPNDYSDRVIRMADKIRELTEDNFVLRDKLSGYYENSELIERIFLSLRREMDILQPYMDDGTISEIMVNGKDDIFILHDAIDNAEREINETLGIHCTIHLDPVITDDEEIVYYIFNFTICLFCWSWDYSTRNT